MKNRWEEVKRSAGSLRAGEEELHGFTNTHSLVFQFHSTGLIFSYIHAGVSLNIHLCEDQLEFHESLFSQCVLRGSTQELCNPGNTREV